MSPVVVPVLVSPEVPVVPEVSPGFEVLVSSLVDPEVESELLDPVEPLMAPLEGSTEVLPVVEAPVLPPVVLPESLVAVTSSPQAAEAENTTRSIVAVKGRIQLTYHGGSSVLSRPREGDPRLRPDGTGAAPARATLARLGCRRDSESGPGQPGPRGPRKKVNPAARPRSRRDMTPYRPCVPHAFPLRHLRCAHACAICDALSSLIAGAVVRGGGRGGRP